MTREAFARQRKWASINNLGPNHLSPPVGADALAYYFNAYVLARVDEFSGDVESLNDDITMADLGVPLPSDLLVVGPAYFGVDTIPGGEFVVPRYVPDGYDRVGFAGDILPYFNGFNDGEIDGGTPADGSGYLLRRQGGIERILFSPTRLTLYGAYQGNSIIALSADAVSSVGFYAIGFTSAAVRSASASYPVTVTASLSRDGIVVGTCEISGVTGASPDGVFGTFDRPYTWFSSSSNFFHSHEIGPFPSSELGSLSSFSVSLSTGDSSVELRAGDSRVAAIRRLDIPLWFSARTGNLVAPGGRVSPP